MVPIMVLWVNIHGLFFLGLVILWTMLLGAVVDYVLDRWRLRLAVSRMPLGAVLASEESRLAMAGPASSWDRFPVSHVLDRGHAGRGLHRTPLGGWRPGAAPIVAATSPA